VCIVSRICIHYCVHATCTVVGINTVMKVVLCVVVVVVYKVVGSG
jgi:hypothetical protein